MRDGTPAGLCQEERCLALPAFVLLFISRGVRLCTSLCEGCKVHSTLPRHVCAKAQQGCNYLGLVQHFTRSKNTCLLIEGEYRGQLHAKGNLSSHMQGETHISARQRHLRTTLREKARSVHYCTSVPVCVSVAVCISCS